MKKRLSFSFIAVILLAAVCLTAFAGCGESDGSVCSDCGANNDASAKFCKECGASLSASADCKACGHKNEAGSKFCSSCGNSLSSQGSQSNGTNGGSENEGGDSSTETDPAESVWLKIKRSSLNGYSYSEFGYDRSGYLTSEALYLTSTGAILGGSRYVNDQYGNPLTHSFSAAGRTVDETYRYEYDENGRMLRQYVYYVTTSPDSEGEKEEAYSYDGEGRLIELLNLKSGGKTVYEYGEGGKLLLSKGYLKDGTPVSETRLTYLENGLISKEETTKFGDEYNYTVLYVKNYLYSPNDASTKTENTVDDSKRLQTITLTYVCDENGNIIRDDDNSYEYMSLAEYRRKGLHENSDKLSCDCGDNGHSTCQGHLCTVCEGSGKLTCKSCNGSGKDSAGEFNGSDACRTCKGLGWWICDNCGGGGKWFLK